MPYRLLLVFALFLGTSCAHTPKHLVLTEPPLAEANQALGGKSEIVVVRTGIFGFAISFGIVVNGQHVGSIRSNDYVHTTVDPGEVTVVATSEADCSAKFPAVANNTYYVRAIPKMGWMTARVQLEMMDPKEGKEARADCEDHTTNAGKDPRP